MFGICVLTVVERYFFNNFNRFVLLIFIVSKRITYIYFYWICIQYFKLYIIYFKSCYIFIWVFHFQNYVIDWYSDHKQYCAPNSSAISDWISCAVLLGVRLPINYVVLARENSYSTLYKSLSQLVWSLLPKRFVILLGPFILERPQGCTKRYLRK